MEKKRFDSEAEVNNLEWVVENLVCENARLKAEMTAQHTRLTTKIQSLESVIEHLAEVHSDTESAYKYDTNEEEKTEGEV